eukprot:27387-Chlamydomonas_euryale.AAC.14
MRFAPAAAQQPLRPRHAACRLRNPTGATKRPSRHGAKTREPVVARVRRRVAGRGEGLGNPPTPVT